MQKTARKNTLYSKNESMLKIAKIGLDAKAIDFAKKPLWVKNQKFQKGAKNDSTITLELLYAKNRLEKTPIIRKMRAF